LYYKKESWDLLGTPGTEGIITLFSPCDNLDNTTNTSFQLDFNIKPPTLCSTKTAINHEQVELAVANIHSGVKKEQGASGKLLSKMQKSGINQ
jgi:hypothetical protein